MYVAFMCVCIYVNTICAIFFMCCIVIFELWRLWCWILSVEWFADKRASRSHCRRFSSSQVSLKESLESRRWYWKLICFYEVFKNSTFSSFWRYCYSQKSLYYKRWYYSTLFQSKTQLFQKLFLPFDSHRME